MTAAPRSDHPPSSAGRISRPGTVCSSLRLTAESNRRYMFKVNEEPASSLSPALCHRLVLRADLARQSRQMLIQIFYFIQVGCGFCSRLFPRFFDLHWWDGHSRSDVGIRRAGRTNPSSIGGNQTFIVVF